MFAEFIDGLDFSVISDALLSIIPALICITIHELCHGLAALLLGDPTAKKQGRLSLNPIKHLDTTGILMMIVFKFGWAKPVPVDMRYFKKPKTGMAITAFAGPLANIILSVIFLFIYGFVFYPLSKLNGFFSNAVLQTILNTAYLSTALAVFNIIPIPPLDGSKVLFSFLPDYIYSRLMKYEKYGMIILVALMFFKVLSKPLSIAAGYVFDSLFFFAESAFKLYRILFV